MFVSICVINIMHCTMIKKRFSRRTVCLSCYDCNPALGHNTCTLAAGGAREPRDLILCLIHQKQEELQKLYMTQLELENTCL